MTNHNFMKTAIHLAEKNVGNTGKNPSVACLIELENNIIGIGLTGNHGRPHAEYNALANSKSNVKGSTAYVTLEPCSHEGETPSCARILAEAGIKKVVSPILDPNPIVNGEGFALLSKLGVEVELCARYAADAQKLIEGFSKNMLTGKPFVTLKLATSLDGKIALKSGESKWISGIDSRKYTQLLRFKNDAVMIGSNTFQADNPELKVREKFGSDKQPARVLLSTSLKLKPDGKIFDSLQSQRTLIFTCSNYNENWEAWETAGAEIFTIEESEGKLNLHRVLSKLGSLGISSLLVEGGSKLSASLISDSLVDRIIIFYSGKIFGSTGVSAISSLSPLSDEIDNLPEFFIEDSKKYGNDLMVSWIKNLNHKEGK